MSERAISAYENDEMPKSRWTKMAIVQRIIDICKENDVDKLINWNKLTKKELEDKFLIWSSWHHTGKFATETDFYKVDENKVLNFIENVETKYLFTEQEIKNFKQKTINKAKKDETIKKKLKLTETLKKTFFVKFGFECSSVAAYLLLNKFTTRISRSGNKVYCFEYRDKIYNVAEQNLKSQYLYGYSALTDMHITSEKDFDKCIDQYLEKEKKYATEELAYIRESNLLNNDLAKELGRSQNALSKTRQRYGFCKQVQNEAKAVSKANNIKTYKNVEVAR